MEGGKLKASQRISRWVNSFPENVVFIGLLLIVGSLITSIMVGGPLLTSFEVSVSGVASTVFVLGSLLIVVSLPIVIAKKSGG